jgi:hypothetical protein
MVGTDGSTAAAAAAWCDCDWGTQQLLLLERCCCWNAAAAVSAGCDLVQQAVLPPLS